jgi:hypothetical protein
MGLGVRVIFARCQGGLLTKSPLRFLPLGWVARAPWKQSPIHRVESHTRALVRAPSPHSLAKETEKESTLAEATQHARFCFGLTLCDPGMVESLFSEWYPV